SMTSPVNNNVDTDTNKKPAAVIVSNTVNLRTGPGTTYSSADQAQPGEKLAVLDQKDGWYQVSRGGVPFWVAGWVVDVAWEEHEPIPEPEPEPKPVETPQPKPEEIKEDVIKLSYTKDETGITLKMTSGSKLNPEIEKTASGLTYTYKDMQIEGLNLIKQDIGSNQLRMRGINSGNDAIISVEIPAGVEFRTETLDKGKTEAIIIPNFILNIERKAFGSTGERIIITTIAPVEYTKTQQDDKVIFEFKDLLLGKARSQYSFNSSLIKGVTLEELSGKNPGVIMTIATKELGQSSAGVGSDGAFNIMLRGKSETRQVRENLIVLDPGHGGSDSGARGSTLTEKEVNLDIALQVGEILKKKGYEVEYTRTGDTYVGLQERANIANRLNAAVFVSIHNNSFTTNDKMGTETFFYAPVSNPDLFLQKDDRERLARNIHNQLLSKLRRIDRGVKQENYSVLRNTNMPSALVEIMFINNPTEEQLLKQSNIRALAAEAIAEGIDQYMKGR
ncbi:MAG: SH3 domain-containing protein, partial [Syntrophomonadaceae bacterium]|nr:SH3 domain-containing protein [Syntrophomonadaceae bacterium]